MQNDKLMPRRKIVLCGLWKKTFSTKTGETVTYISGSLGFNKITLEEVKTKKTEKHPDYLITIEPYPRREPDIDGNKVDF